MRIPLLIASFVLVALGSAPAIKSAPIGFHKAAPEQSLIPVQQKKWAGKGKMGGKGKGKGMGKGKGPGCFDRCMATSSSAMTAATGCSARCR